MNNAALTSFASELEPTSALDSAHWVQLLPLGTAKPIDGRKPWKVANPAAIIKASAKALARGLPVDFDHALDRPATASSAPAAGWIDQLEARANGIWGRVSWTSEGREKIAGRVYRFISPVFHHTEDGTITAIVRAGLTNRPALEMTAICAEDATDPDDVTPAPKAKAGPDTTDEAGMQARITKIALSLGLEETATISALLTEIESRLPDMAAHVPAKATAAVDEGGSAASVPLTAVADYIMAAGKERQAERNARAVADAMRDGLLPPYLEEWGTALCESDPDAFQTYLRNSPLRIGGGAILPSSAPRLTSTASAKDDPAAAIAAQLGLQSGFQKS